MTYRCRPRAVSAGSFPLTTLLIPACLLLGVGCGDPLKDPALIEETRVLGAKVEVEADPALAWPSPGESATVRWLVASPKKREPLTWAFEVCEAEDVVRGLPRCAAAPLASGRVEEPTDEDPTLQFQVPEREDLLGRQRLVILGGICSNGMAEPGASWEEFRCVGEGARRELVMLTVTLATEEDRNHNPNLGDAPLSFDGEDWPEWEGYRGSCADVPDEVPRVKAGSEGHSVKIRVRAKDREPLASRTPAEPQAETYQLSHVVTGGELDRAYSVVDDHEPETRLGVGWDAPERVDEDGRLVRFFFVARDLRGGTDWTSRAVCVTP